jgi:hypothetical protein
MDQDEFLMSTHGGAAMSKTDVHIGPEGRQEAGDTPGEKPGKHNTSTAAARAMRRRGNV